MSPERLDAKYYGHEELEKECESFGFQLRVYTGFTGEPGEYITLVAKRKVGDDYAISYPVPDALDDYTGIKSRDVEDAAEMAIRQAIRGKR